MIALTLVSAETATVKPKTPGLAELLSNFVSKFV